MPNSLRHFEEDDFVLGVLAVISLLIPGSHVDVIFFLLVL